MPIKLIKKEFSLCLHPTSFIFLCFAAFVFIPNYPYEVMFFFSGLAVFFTCLTARENGDLAFTCALPVRKKSIATARILYFVVFQAALLCLAGAATAVKELCFPESAQINLAGMTANTAFLGFGALLLGVFNIIFFPLYFKNPDKVGQPFIVASAVLFALIFALIVLRFALPAWSVLNTPDPAHMGIKAGVLAAGLAAYAGLTAWSCYLSGKRFEAFDL